MPDNIPLSKRRVNPLTAVGILLIIIAGTSLITYTSLISVGRSRASQGPPEEFIQAATQQSVVLDQPMETLSIQGTPPQEVEGQNDLIADVDDPTPGNEQVSEDAALEETDNQHGDWPLPDYVDVSYWLSIPALELEAPIIALSPREREIDGVTLLRLPVPNSYSVAWHTGSAEPGFAGNTILSGHNNLYGGVFQNLYTMTYGQEIAVWSEYGVFSYYISVIEYVEEEDQPVATRLGNAHWLSQSADDRITLITCWPHDHSSHRLIIVATR